jgi:hypothetical protein
LESRGSPVGDARDEVEQAVEGAAKPQGLGSWFSRARFEGLTLRMASEPGEAVN